MRSLAIALMLAGCASRGDGVASIPDARVDCIGDFNIVAPRPGLHYAPALEAYVDESELQGELTLIMLDSQGRSYAWTDEGSQPDPQDPGITSHDRFHYDLAPNERYTLTVAHCATEQAVTFFTSSP